MRESVVRTSELPLELKADPSCSEPDPDPLNLSLPYMNAPNLAPSTPPAERVRAWARSCRSSLLSRMSASAALLPKSGLAEIHPGADPGAGYQVSDFHHECIS